MRYIRRLRVDDLAVITTIAGNKRIPVANRAIFDSVSGKLPAAYKEYLKVRGCPVSLLPMATSDEQKKRLKSLYASEVVGLEFIEEVRNRLSPEVCPMCGKPSNGGEVDHFVEKHTHPEFSFFSPNLVPACKCNGRRTACWVGGVRVRPLHPYFDKILRRRLVRANFEGAFASPTVNVVTVGGFGAYRDRVEAHVRSIMIPNGVQVWLAKQWELLLLSPLKHLSLTTSPASVPELRAHLTSLRDRADLMYGSLNGWEAVWLTGLIANPRALRGVWMLLGGSPIGAIPAL
ncbi:hypothetical protein LYB30171_01097 [Lysobacter luteus]|uniref:HNH endonuclease n=1 Tax=Novilysobacter luteus TaxID=2822368 RepID=A0ABM8UEP0_9GAMM|nr:hypothetical protein LYB30171_01097 [Lysobacter luteus]